MLACSMCGLCVPDLFIESVETVGLALGEEVTPARFCKLVAFVWPLWHWERHRGAWQMQFMLPAVPGQRCIPGSWCGEGIGGMHS